MRDVLQDSSQRRIQNPMKHLLKGAISGLTQFLVTESTLKMMKKHFYFTLKALLVLKIFIFLYYFSRHVEKQLHQKDTVNFKIFDVTTLVKNSCNTYIDHTCTDMY